MVVNLLTVGLALIAVVYSARSLDVGRRQVDLAAEAALAQRVSTAVDQLGASAAEVRFNGVLTLDALIHASPKDQPFLLDVLAGFVRRQTVPSVSTPTRPAQPLSDEVQVALNAIGRRDPRYDGRFRLNLAGTDLRYARLQGAYLVRADLHRTLLDGADLSRANLWGADLRTATLDHANVQSARLERADMERATAVGLRAENANLRWIEGRYGDFSGAVLTSADLTGAHFGSYDPTLVLQQTGVSGGVSLREARLQSANLTQANFTRADLNGADLTAGIGLSQTQLDCVAATNASTKLPAGLRPPVGWPQPAGNSPRSDSFNEPQRALMNACLISSRYASLEAGHADVMADPTPPTQ
jgi:hypothetical protein